VLCRSFKLDDCGEGAYKMLLQEYPRVTRVFLGLFAGARAVITDICKRMGAGMAEFIEREVVSVGDFDLYCHYVAGEL
jgi:farnesyl-diphosphate farnesyltransferase